MEDNSSKKANDEMEVVSKWVDEVEQAFCSMLSDHQRLHLLVRLISRCSCLLLFQLYRHMVSICEFDFVCLLPDCAVYRLLSYLDVKTLLTACQVSKSWNSIISKNQRIWRDVCTRNSFLVPAELSAEQLADASFSKNLYLKTAVLVERLMKELPGETISLRGHTRSIDAVFFYNGKLATGSSDNTVRIWDCATGDCLATYRMHLDLVLDIKFDDDFIVTASEDRSAACWNVSNGTRLQTFLHRKSVHCVDFNTIVDVLVTGSDDYRVSIWSFTGGNLLRTMEFRHVNKPVDDESASRVCIWGTHDGCFHILASNDSSAIDYEIGLGMTVVEKTEVFSLTADSLYFIGYHVDGSSLKFWIEEHVSSSGFRTVSENSFECVNSCGRSSLTKRPTTRIVRLPYINCPLEYLTSGACFDVFIAREEYGRKGWLYVTGCNSEMRRFTIDLPESAKLYYLLGICICEDQWLDGISEEALCNKTLLAVATSDDNIELLQLKSPK